jgi:hypothetical protein
MKSSMQPKIQSQTESSEETPMVNGMVASKFIVKLRETFLSAEAKADLWSDAFANKATSTNRNTLIAMDIASAFRSVFLRNEDLAAPEPGGEGSAARRMKQLLDGDAADWPNDDSFPVPEPYNRDAFRHYEVGCAVAILMEAFHKDGAGGEPTDFPPSKPH